ALYVRAAGPESVQIRNVDDWNNLLDRCLSHRSDLLGNVLRQSLARQSRPGQNVIGILRAAIEDTAKDFTTQTHLLAEKLDAKYRDGVISAGKNYSALGYALVDSSGNLVEI